MKWGHNMDPQLPWEEGVDQLSKSFLCGQQSVRTVAAFCLEKISATDGQLQAWTELQPDRVLAEADDLDRLIRAGIFLGPLHGVPVGIKDIIDVRGYASAAGYGPWKQAVARQDAEVVARLRSQGALILGKTATCPFASFDPAPTRHPAFSEKTPGGSSAGSAAAVAAGHCPLALGSQTGGSILRPAAYCGIVGFKPTHGLIPTQGVVPLAPTLDHVGLLSSTLQGVGPTLQAMAGQGLDVYRSPDRPEDHLLLVWPDVEELLGSAGTGWKLAVEGLKSRGISIRKQSSPKALATWLLMHQKIMAREAFLWHNVLEPRWKERYPPKIASLLAFGESLTGLEMAEAYRIRREARQFLSKELEDQEFLFLPTIHAGIPERDNTGDYRYQGLASFVGFPSLGLPWDAKGGFSAGLFGESVQLIGNPNADLQLLAVAGALVH